MPQVKLLHSVKTLKTREKTRTFIVTHLKRCAHIVWITLAPSLPVLSTDLPLPLPILSIPHHTCLITDFPTPRKSVAISTNLWYLFPPFFGAVVG